MIRTSGRCLALAAGLLAAGLAARADTVVLVHGLGRGPLSMARLAGALERDGHTVRNLGYASQRDTLPELAEAVFGPVFREAAEGESVHVVTHSMGGILLRQYLHDHGVPAGLGRVVMLGPPNQGSEIVDRLGGWGLFRRINGPAGVRLGTSARGAPRSLGAWPAEVALGVIAGDRSWNPFFSAMIPGADDGKVSVARTHLEGEAGHVTVAASHTWLMWRGEVIARTRAFLRDGCFGSQS
ncbi:MAG: alpha/beta fold hydrolase [Verrucomicrobiota bacterium]